MEALALCVIIGTVIVGLATQYRNAGPPRDSQPPSRKKRVIIKKNGQQKQYRVNQYGEVFEE